MVYVVSVSGPVGGGKTSLVRGVAGTIEESSALHFDGYQRITELPIDAIMQWMQRGGDLDEFVVEGLAEDLAALGRGEDVVEVLTQRPVAANKYILFETPFGRAHAATARFIDLSIWIDTPLDIALARRVREMTAEILTNNEPGSERESIQWMDGYLRNYLDAVRDMLVKQRELIGGKADVVLNGEFDLASMVDAASQEILRRLP